MSKVAKFSVSLAASMVLTALCTALFAGLSVETLVSPHFWIISISLAGLFGLTMGDGIGEPGDARRANLPATGLLPA